MSSVPSAKQHIRHGNAARPQLVGAQGCEGGRGLASSTAVQRRLEDFDRLTTPLLSASCTVGGESARACVTSKWDTQVTASAAAFPIAPTDRGQMSERSADAYAEARRGAPAPAALSPPRRAGLGCRSEETSGVDFPVGGRVGAPVCFPGAAIYALPFIPTPRAPVSTSQSASIGDGEDTDMPPLVGDRPADNSEVARWLEDRSIQPTAETSDFYSRLYDDGVQLVQDLHTLAVAPRFAEVVPEAGVRRRIKAALRAERHAADFYDEL
eukprot:TRINITY_DN10355_c0_g1_i1.p2 TRINITY_DN10355_c0_g1~~TRINITY_DN10355_c0_g1_i1.p2  ORF type:complete len:268 (+),score=28.72 TRINITY_DN10355_c0_g1_i1:744-1547(+)